MNMNTIDFKIGQREKEIRNKKANIYARICVWMRRKSLDAHVCSHFSYFTWSLLFLIEKYIFNFFHSTFLVNKLKILECVKPAYGGYIVKIL